MKRILPVLAVFLALIPLSCESPVSAPEVDRISDLQPSFTYGLGLEGQMIFTTNRDGNFDIYWMDLKKGKLKNLTKSETSFDQMPSWSPTGDQIVFTSDRGKTKKSLQDTDLWLMDIGTQGGPSNPKWLADGGDGDYEAAWSPDGLKIAWRCQATSTVFRNGIPRNFRHGDICYVSRTSLTSPWGPMVRLVNDPNTNDIGPSWSPASDKIIFQKTCPSRFNDFCAPPGYVDLVTVDLSGTETNVTNTPLLDEGAPAWGSGTDIAYVVLKDGDPDTEELWMGVLGSAGLVPTGRIGPAGGHDAWPLWTPDYLQIVFTRGTDLVRDIYIMDRAGGGETLLVSSPGFDGLGRIRPN